MPGVADILDGVAILDHQAVTPNVWCIDTGLYRPRHTACYLIADRGELAFVDSGSSNNVPGLLAVLDRLGFQPQQVRYVMPTHVHLDHAGGAGALMAACPNATLVTHERGIPHMVDPTRLQAGASAVYGEQAFQATFGTLMPVPAARAIAARDGQTFQLGTRRIAFADTPGHANHHGCFFDEPSRLWFTGDTFGLSYREFDRDGDPLVLATTTPVAFDPDAWLASIDRLLAAAPTGMCLTHFGSVRQPQLLANQLRDSVQAHAQLAVREEAHEEPGRAERLRHGVTELLLSRVRAHRPDLSAAVVHRLLDMDIELNAQGLAVWLKRRAKAAAATAAR
jgi:glyoxylase-like metal-dependent hydrolase (beta-lactamase superfamily II)